MPLRPSSPAPVPPSGQDHETQDRVGLSWLMTVRWAAIVAAAGAVFAGVSWLDASPPMGALVVVVGASAVSNLWLGWRLRRPAAVSTAFAASLVASDVIVLSWVLFESGGVLNPASIFYLVDIVLAALVLRWRWTWIITALSVCGYGALYLSPVTELDAARAMHPEIGSHVRGMWLAFAATSLLVAALVARLAAMVERRDRTLEELRARASRDARLAGLATLAAGAAHELSTPLGTISVAACELERSLEGAGRDPLLLEDVRLIRAEIDRCRRVLDDMAARAGEPVGEAPTPRTIGSLAADALAALPATDRRRVDVEVPDDMVVRWPVGAITRVLTNLVANGLQASVNGGRVVVRAVRADDGLVALSVEDHGHGMSADVQARVGEPFYSTKPEGSGMGLGLFVARSTADRLGGALSVSSQPGVGTRVVVTLPEGMAHG